MRVAILEDDPAQAALVVRVLEGAGYAPVALSSGRELLASLRQETFDLLILDWESRQVSGLAVTVWARSHLSPTPPILMLARRAASDAIVEGLNAGADDFLVKPVDPAILHARVHAVLRRAYASEAVSRLESFGPVAFDLLNQEATVEGTKVQLTSKEFALALLLFRNMHQAVSRTYLLEAVWGRDLGLGTRTLDAHISKIRTKLMLRPERGFRLATVYSYGYRLERLADNGKPGLG